MIQQGAQVFADLGGGAAGVATAAHLAKGMIKGGSEPIGGSGGTPPSGGDSSGGDK